MSGKDQANLHPRKDLGYTNMKVGLQGNVPTSAIDGLNRPLVMVPGNGVTQQSTNTNLIGGKYRLLSIIGSGSFGDVYHAYNITNNLEVAIKMCKNVTTSISQLQYESKIYRVISNGQHVPYAKLLGDNSVNKQALVMDLLGPSLNEILMFINGPFSVKTVCLLAEYMIEAVEHIHKHSIVHCDIKPDNYLLGLGHNFGRVYMVDFGLSRQFRHASNHNHVAYHNNRSLIGTARYVSINGHVGITPSRRDDLESIGYVLVYLCLTKLPWQGIECPHYKQKYDRICEKKISTPVSVLCQDLPMEFMMFINYCRHLRYDQDPDYAFVQSLFRNLVKSELQRSPELPFEWLSPKFTIPMKEYLINSSLSFYNYMASMGQLRDVYISPLVDAYQRNLSNAVIAQLYEAYLQYFFRRYPHIIPNSITYTIKNYYKKFFIASTEKVKVLATSGRFKRPGFTLAKPNVTNNHELFSQPKH